jgi:hypothetical protein
LVTVGDLERLAAKGEGADFNEDLRAESGGRAAYPRMTPVFCTARRALMPGIVTCRTVEN